MATPEPPNQPESPQPDDTSHADVTQVQPAPQAPTDAPPPGVTQQHPMSQPGSHQPGSHQAATPPPGIPAPPAGQPQVSMPAPGQQAPGQSQPGFAQPGQPYPGRHVPYPPVPGMAATASQPMWPVQPPQFPQTGQQQSGPMGSYPAMHPVPQPYALQQQAAVQQAPGRQATPRAPRTPIPGKDLAAGAALIVAAGLAVGGSIPILDHMVDRTVIDSNTVGDVDNVVETSAWFFHSDTPGHPDQAYHLTQYFGVALAVGALLALVMGVLLVIGLGRRDRRFTVWGAVAAGVLFGTLLATEMSPINDMQADSYVPPGGHFVPGQHVTTFGLGFWLLLGAGVVAIAAIVLLLLRDRRVEPPTPRFGIPAQAYPATPSTGQAAAQPGVGPMGAPQSPGYPPQQFPGSQHG